MTAKSRAADRAARVEPTEVNLPAAARLGQQTMIEQSRAVAEVQGAIIVAQRVPRDIPAALAEMRAACAQPGLADRAFFRYRRGDGQITGATVHLARELARCWRNVQYGVGELERNDGVGQSQMLAWAWDVQNNTRASSTFIVPHKRDRTADKGGPVLLTDMRDIYENNANAAARRLREQVFAILPVWFVDEAKNLCAATLANPGDGKTRDQRVADSIAGWSSKGITVQQLEDKLGRPANQWTDPDLAQLRVVWSSIGRGETTLTEEFAPQRVSAAEITAAATRPATTPTELSTQDGEEWPATPEPGSGGKP